MSLIDFSNNEKTSKSMNEYENIGILCILGKFIPPCSFVTDSTYQISIGWKFDTQVDTTNQTSKSPNLIFFVCLLWQK